MPLHEVNRKAFSLIFILFSATSVITPFIASGNVEWDYSNYLYDLRIECFENPVQAGRTGFITASVGANTAVTAHVELKGSYSWGEWTYDLKEIQLSPGESEFIVELCVPSKLVVEPICLFYYYVYITLPGEQWDPECWGLTTELDIILPAADISLEGIDLMMSHLVWKVESSKLSEIIKKVLIKKIERLWETLRDLYYQDDFEKIYEILEFILNLKNKLCSGDFEASDYRNYIAEYLEN